ncbi:MAG: hypothetical protein RMY28_037340 [Nostoc sp. ChiSLP01]|nr:hypothetical protein [Nostoc sp. CmiSLP01]MDZ8287359.1 hypothetical protein [Nostoc sp. ChiSLP01]
MTEQQTTERITNGRQPTANTSRRGKKKEWKDLSVDPLAEGFDGHQAEYVIGKSPVTWATVQPGQLFSRSKSGKNLHVKLNDGRGVCLDTRQPIEVKPSIRNTLQVWLVTNFNSTSATKADF